MSLARRRLPLVALLLALVVGGQTTDLLPCADEGCGVWHVLTGERADHPEPEGHGDGEAMPDCLCHFTYTSTARTVALHVSRVPEALREAAPPARAPLTRRVLTPPPQG